MFITMLCLYKDYARHKQISTSFLNYILLAFIMQILSIQEALNKKSGKVTIHGWVYRERKLKDKVFLVIRDSSNIIQCVVDKEKVSKKIWEDSNKLLIESSLEISGELYQDKRAPTNYEIKVASLDIIQFADIFPKSDLFVLL